MLKENVDLLTSIIFLYRYPNCCISMVFVYTYKHDFYIILAILNKYCHQDRNKRRIGKLLHLFIKCLSTLAKNMPCCCSRKMLFDKRYSLKSYKVYLI